MTHERTFLVSAGRGAHDPDGGRPAGAPVNRPVDFTSTFVHRRGAESRYEYAREGLPSWEPLEEVLAALEGGTRSTWSGQGMVVTAHEATVTPQPAVLFSSGMAAISAALHLLPLGAHLILPRHSYKGLGGLTQQMAERGMLTVHRVDIAHTEQVLTTLSDVAALAQAQEQQVMLWLESPTNPMLEVADLPELIAQARRRGMLTVVDNTFATPLRQQPLKHGADVVVHSVTKFLSGHSDLIMGAAITCDPDLHRRMKEHQALHGATPGALDVFLALRGVRTLAVRLDQAERNAAELARRLEGLLRAGEPGIRQVRHPSLTSHPQHERAAVQLGTDPDEHGRPRLGFGAVLTVELESGPLADAVVDGLRVWTPATSLGGVESLAERRARYPDEPPTVPEGLIRLSVGIEHVDDLFEDLVTSLRAAAAESDGAGANG
ncbi:trans-sulfuration enzyme family protein [Nesterenkonia aerolata]|uniref:PLP-dependent aspartate aminotransferase family protein n=1 Tax=Nesterenkonia aerolata TaxID=3074079 RepID=A0ABU2DQW8_9MICC|nr:PLP-dependent aspartate aminotransferase family protein [Nesterenkonia sp. LY-0111]MDR8018765.1 PLP-dependent aspartate aminotransferase family protein [Nesterenkonia sp. LY-0111]